MTGFNYIRTPASQFAYQADRKMARSVDITWFRGEHTEDFLRRPVERRCELALRSGAANGNLGRSGPAS
jgi:hypothetical protein